MLSGLLIVGLSDRGVIVLAVVVGVLILSLIDGEAMCRPIHLVFLVFVVRLETCVGQSFGLALEVLTNG